MKSIHIAALALLASGAGATALASPIDSPAAGTAAAAGVVTAPAAKIKCIRGKEIGSNRIKRVCLPEDQLRRLSPDERADLFRADKPAAEVLAD